MNVMSQIAEARAAALSLRASARACSAEQGALKFRLTHAAEALDGVVLLAVRGLDRIEELASVDLTPLRQASRMLQLVGEVADASDLGPDDREVLEVIKVTRVLIDGVFDKLTASRQQGGAA